MLERSRAGVGLLYYFGPRARASSYLTHVSDDHGIVYVEVPKAGCTVIKRMLQCHELGGRVDLVADDVHRRDLSPLLRPEDSTMGMSGVFGGSGRCFRFTFVRDPYSRALSGYLDKFISSRRGKAQRLAKLGLPPDASLGFTRFLELVSEQPLRKMDIHWAPQYDLLGRRRVRYDFIGRFETIQRDLEHLTERLALDYPDDLVGSFTRHTTQASARMREHFDPDAVSLVQKIYGRDFDEFGYSRDFATRL